MCIREQPVGSDLTVCPIGFCNSTMVKERKCTEDIYALLFKALTLQGSVHTGADVERGFRGGCEEGTRGQDQTSWGSDGLASQDQIEQLVRLLQQPWQSRSNAALQLRADDYHNLHPTALSTDTAGNRQGSGLRTRKKVRST